MPIQVEHVRPPDVTEHLVSPLRHETLLKIQWTVTGAIVNEQTCAIQLDADPRHKFTHWVDPTAREHMFHLPAGMVFDTNHLMAIVEINPGPNVDRATAQIEYPSAVIPEREAMTAVYSEHSQELRRMRTFYETFLVVVTGGFAILVSNAASIAGSHFSLRLMGIGLLLLACIIMILVWFVATRYNRTDQWLENIEIALGLKSGPIPVPIMPKIDKWSFRHRFWSLALMFYTLVLGICGFVILANRDASANSAKSPAAKQESSSHPDQQPAKAPEQKPVSNQPQKPSQ